jgi:hypothetical protein
MQKDFQQKGKIKAFSNLRFQAWEIEAALFIKSATSIFHLQMLMDVHLQPSTCISFESICKLNNKLKACMQSNSTARN